MLRTATLRRISIHVAIFKSPAKNTVHAHNENILASEPQNQVKEKQKYHARNSHVNRHYTPRQMKINNVAMALRAERYLKFASK